jgi:hypothetical protein
MGQSGAGTYGYPDQVGSTGSSRFENVSTAYLRPLRKRTIQQDSTSFVATNNSFDTLARPVSTTKSSTISGNPAKTEAFTYHNDTALWALSQVASVKCTGSVPASAACDGDVVSQTDYGWKALPSKTYRFGKPQQTFSYDSTSTVASGQLGTLKTVTDGRGNVTTLTQWKRGVPGKITYPATTDQPTAVSQSATINDDGTIATVTDENDYKTCYGYDAMGRLNKITYPSETQLGVCDTSTWNPTTITFNGGNTAAYGMPAGHWRQTTMTGRGRKIIIYDALWRPVVEQTVDLDRISATLSEVIRRYDAAGQLAFQSYPMNTNGAAVYTDPALKGTKYTYDALDRPLTMVQDSELGALTTTTAYLSNVTGPYVQVTNPRGHWSRTWHQAYDQPSHDHPVIIQTSGGQYTYVTRDAFGKPTKLRRSNDNTPTGGTGIDRFYSYNAYQELCRTVEPETGATLAGYDGAGNWPGPPLACLSPLPATWKATRPPLWRARCRAPTTPVTASRPSPSPMAAATRPGPGRRMDCRRRFRPSIPMSRTRR